MRPASGAQRCGYDIGGSPWKLRISIGLRFRPRRPVRNSLLQWALISSANEKAIRIMEFMWEMGGLFIMVDFIIPQNDAPLNIFRCADLRRENESKFSPSLMPSTRDPMP